MKHTKIDWDYVAELLKARNSIGTIAKTLGVSRPTLYQRCEEELGISLSEYKDECRIAGEDSLKTKMYEVAMKGNTNMLIWLSRNWLGYSEKPKEETEQTVTVNFNLVQ